MQVLPSVLYDANASFAIFGMRDDGAQYFINVACILKSANNFIMFRNKGTCGIVPILHTRVLYTHPYIYMR